MFAVVIGFDVAAAYQEKLPKLGTACAAQLHLSPLSSSYFVYF